MASKKKESEGIALLSMYGDEDDDMEEDVDTDDNHSDNGGVQPQENKEQGEVGANETVNMEEDDAEALTVSNDVGYDDGSNADQVVILDSANDNTTSVSVDNLTPPLPPPAREVIGAEPSRVRKGTLTIVDYGHDEAALSPEAELTGRVMFGAELQTANGTPPGTVQLLTPSTQSTPPQSSEHVDQSQSDAMNYKGKNQNLQHLKKV
ncbi:hypothetical protein OSB04_012834 [Centaurea solstitialis]|uniref:Uncharacterized protein n=1 Tax=Centaurea solstitialis TaxID=347529 RepID=A0AA38TNT2_9ASTR|nr:hypothetical protein OSB04_012834 [Centaurea solstitialis]